MTLFDTHEEVTAIGRELTEVEREGRPVKMARVTRTYRTSVEDLWDTVTTPERLRRWFSGVSGDLREGGRYAIEGNAEGTIEACDPPRRLDLTWEFGGQVSWVEVILDEADDGARLQLVHTAEVDNEWWERYGAGATGVGWDLSLLGLSLHLANPDAARPVEDGWEATPQGREFVEASSNGWADASIAGGTPAEQARASARRTTAFYTGDEV